MKGALIMENQLLREANELQQQLSEWRRALHQIPEIGLKLPKTVAFVTKELEKMGIAYTVHEDCSCVVALIGHSGKCMMLRSDMDALPIQEESGESFASQNGCMHACGHDMHAAILLGAAKLLKAHENELKGTVKLVFQSAEETFMGAKAAVDAGVLENPKVDAAFAMHVAPNSENKKIIYGEYPMASVYGFRIILTGKGTHGSTPEFGVDPINTGVHVYLALQELIAREVSAMEEAVLTIGNFKTESAFNVIPQRAVLEGSLRTFKAEIREYMIRRIHEVTKSIAEAYRSDFEIEVLNDVPAVKCDVALNDEIIGYVKELDPEMKAYPTFHVMGSEDFSYFSDQVPASYFFIGAGVDNENEWVGHHNPHAKFNETCLPAASAIYAKTAMDWLAKHA